jgi:hypothetical protein
LRNPIRLAYVEELSTDELDADFLKDFVDGDRITCEVLYGTEESHSIQAKLITCSNKDLNVRIDNGVARRGKLQYYNSRFDSIEQDDPVNGLFKRVDGIELYFDNHDYKLAYFHLLLQYVGGLRIPKSADKDFKETVMQVDSGRQRLEELYEITNNKDDFVPKAILEQTLAPMKWIDILSMIRVIGLNYNRDKRGPGYRGVVEGLKVF